MKIWGKGEMRKKQIRIIEGNDYGKIKVITANREGKYVKYTCQCNICNRFFTSRGQNILKNKDGGCPECRSSEKLKKRLEQAKENIGKQYGDMTIVEILGYKPHNNVNLMMVKCQCSCGGLVMVPLSKVKAGQIKSCGHMVSNNLAKGREIGHSGDIDGTQICTLSPGRKINKNSTTGIKGVSYAKGGKYRAYINFKRKQYCLGTFQTPKEAKKAREIAEREIYGNFLEWYNQNYVHGKIEDTEIGQE